MIDLPQRRHQHLREVESIGRLRDSQGPVRPIAVAGLGRDEPTRFVANHVEASARALITRYTGRNGVEASLGLSVDFFHLDCLASEVRLNVDLDVALTVIAPGCYRWLAPRQHGFGQTKPTQLYRRLVEPGGVVEGQADRLVVRCEPRSPNPILREAGLDRDCPAIPWLGDVPLVFESP